MVGVEQVGFVEHEDGVAAAFVFLGGEQILVCGISAALWKRGVPPRAVTIAAVEAAAADGGVAEVDDGGAAGVQAGQGGPDGDGLAGADFAGDDAEGRVR